MKKGKLIFLCVIYILIIIGSTSKFFLTIEEVGNISYGKLNKDDTTTVTINIQYNNLFKTECSLDGINWKDEVLGSCTYDLVNGNYTIYIRNLNDTISKDFTVQVNQIKSFDINLSKWYLAPDETVKILNKMDYVGNPDLKVSYKSDDESVATVDENGVVTGHANGTTTIHVIPQGFAEKTVEIIVTDIIRKQEIDLSKPKLTCKQYNEEEEALLEDILATRVSQRGEGTRAALLEVIRFATMNLKQKIPYFYEHGRLQPYYKGQSKVDGEGRFYHKGLYLTDKDYPDITYVKEKKATWGCPLTNYDDTDGWAVGSKRPNGLDCSGFVTWSLYNAGLDPGDIGAGIIEDVDDMSDFGDKHNLTYEYANSNDYKVGDIIGRNGHVALIAGKDDENIYISESLLYGVRTVTYSYTDKKSKLYTNYEYIGKLDDKYVSDGDYTDMWQKND